MKILIIEDEVRILVFVARGLQAEGYDVECVADGRQGLERALVGDYDLAVLDLGLPGADGLGLLSELQCKRRELPILILSARSDLQTKLRGFELGASDYLPKPFSLDELIARIRVQLRHKNGNGDGSSIVDLGGLSLDLNRRQARIDDHVVALSDREFHLLHHLVEHAGEVVSRERLLANVWGYHFDSRSNVVEVCIRRLRLKLGEQAPIETVRHAGYRLNVPPS